MTEEERQAILDRRKHIENNSDSDDDSDDDLFQTVISKSEPAQKQSSLQKRGFSFTGIFAAIKKQFPRFNNKKKPVKDDKNESAKKPRKLTLPTGFAANFGKRRDPSLEPIFKKNNSNQLVKTLYNAWIQSFDLELKENEEYNVTENLTSPEAVPNNKKYAKLYELIQTCDAVRNGDFEKHWDIFDSLPELEKLDNIIIKEFIDVNKNHSPYGIMFLGQAAAEQYRNRLQAWAKNAKGYLSPEAFKKIKKIIDNKEIIQDSLVEIVDVDDLAINDPVKSLLEASEDEEAIKILCDKWMDRKKDDKSNILSNEDIDVKIVDDTARATYNNLYNLTQCCDAMKNKPYDATNFSKAAKFFNALKKNDNVNVKKLLTCDNSPKNILAEIMATEIKNLAGELNTARNSDRVTKAAVPSRTTSVTQRESALRDLKNKRTFIINCFNKLKENKIKASKATEDILQKALLDVNSTIKKTETVITNHKKSNAGRRAL